MRSKLLCSRCHVGIVFVASSLGASWSPVGFKAVVTAYAPSSSSFSNNRYTNTVSKGHGTTATVWSPKIISRPPVLTSSSSLLFSSASSTTSTVAENNRPLPTIEQLSSDSFINQVSYAERVITECLIDSSLENKKNAEDFAKEHQRKKQKLEMLKAQLSHSDGIRGFFVTYLTANPVSVGDAAANDDSDARILPVAPADQIPVSPLLIEAMKSVADVDDLIRLACMNVIMPTGMTTMHTDPELSAQSKITATRGVRVLDCLNSIHPIAVQQQVSAIYAVATSSSSSSSGNIADNETDDALIGFWTRFFEKWGYQEKQRNDIAEAVQSIIVK